MKYIFRFLVYPLLVLTATVFELLFFVLAEFILSLWYLRPPKATWWSESHNNLNTSETIFPYYYYDASPYYTFLRRLRYPSYLSYGGDKYDEGYILNGEYKRFMDDDFEEI